MRSAIVAIAVFGLTACSPKSTEGDGFGPLPADPGWHHTWDEYRNWVSYGFGDGSRTVFGGFCNTTPVFLLENSGREPGFGKPDVFLTVDDRTWRLAPSYRVFVDDPAIVDALRNATKRIGFHAADGWSRQFRPDEALSMMIDQCRALRLRDPDARGRLAHLDD